MKSSAIGRRAAFLGGLASAAAAAVPRDAAIPIAIVQGRCVVPVLLDGRAARMLLDTGADISLVTRAAVARLRLRPDPWVSTTLRGASGLEERHANVDVRSARAGTVPLFQRMAATGLNLPVTSSVIGGADGLLGGDILQHYTLDLNIPEARLLLATAPPTARPPDAVHLQLLRRNQLLAPVQLDGHRLVALLDTGASTSLVNARGLYRLGLASKPPQHDPAVPMLALGGETTVHVHRFAELRIGAFRVAAPSLLTQAVPEPAFDLILGLDVLGRQRLVLSYTELTLAFAGNDP
jgi:predicted aspartyl protease